MKKERIKVQPTAEWFNRIYDEISKETAAEGLPYKRVFDRAEHKVRRIGEKLGIHILRLYSDYESFRQVRNRKLKNGKRNNTNKGKAKTGPDVD